MLGTFSAAIDLGISCLFSFNFCVSEFTYGIIGVDFLPRHGLIVDLAAKRLTMSIQIKRVSRYERVGDYNSFTIITEDKNDEVLLDTLQAEYPKVFDSAIRSRAIKHSIIASVETETNEPVAARARRLSTAKYRVLQGEIQRFLDQDILERGQSVWVSPIVLVHKKNGSYRLCADFINLNKILKMQKHALPNINDFLALAHGCHWFSSPDVKDAYYNIPDCVKD